LFNHLLDDAGLALVGLIGLFAAHRVRHRLRIDDRSDVKLENVRVVPARAAGSRPKKSSKAVRRMKTCAPRRGSSPAPLPASGGA
jgi:hypothetical protein